MIHDYFHYSKDELIHKIDQMIVWSNILGYRAELDVNILNPLREDKTLGSCMLVQDYRGIVNIRDFADKKTSGFDCVTAYRYLNSNKSWSEICTDLLQMSPNKISPYVLPAIKPKVKSKFTPFYREWNQHDLDWWGKREVSLEQLSRRDTLTLPIEGYCHEKGNKKSEIHFNEQCYCYHFEDRVKFYFPNRSKYRFLGNLKRDDLWKVKGNSDLIITKAHKDLLVLENCLDLTITHLQAETTFPDEPTLLDWELGFDNILILLDSDEVGKSAAAMLQEQFIYKKPTLLFVEGYKDIDEFIVNEGLRETVEYLNYLLQ